MEFFSLRVEYIVARNLNEGYFFSVACCCIVMVASLSSYVRIAFDANSLDELYALFIATSTYFVFKRIHAFACTGISF